MSESANDPVGALEALRRAYAQSLPGKAQACRAELAKLLRAGSEDAMVALRAAAHRLAGSGTTYGYPAVTEAARAIVEALGEPADASRRARLEAGVAALEVAAAEAGRGEA